MQPFTTVAAPAAPLDMPNVDTDQIIPARFLKRPKDERYRVYLFHDLRFEDEGGAEKPGFILNQEPWRRAQILVADRNFGCGSSRESAVYALMAGGYRAVIAPSFGDIFYNNSLKNGFLPIRLDAAVCADLRRQLHANPGAEITVDLESQTVTAPDGTRHGFELHPFAKHCLLRGLDDIQFTLEYQGDIEAFEERRATEMSWLRNARPAHG